MSAKSWAMAVFAATTLLVIAGLVFSLLAGEPPGLNELLVATLYAFAVVGILITRRRPDNAIGWVCLGIGFVWSLETFLFGTAVYGLANPGTVPMPEVFAAIGIPLWIPGIFGIGTFVFMFFPDGRLPSPRWRWLPWTVGATISLQYALYVLTEPETFSYGRPVFDNPLAGVLGPHLDQGAPMFDLVEISVTVTTFSVIIASLIALITRYIRSRGVERKQLKWLVSAGSAAVVLQVISISLADYYGETVGLVAVFPFILIPISIGIAVLRYRLYDIDRLISRTVGYTVVVATLSLVFTSIALGLPRLAGLPDHPVLVAGATLAVAAMFNPLRRRVQHWVDSRFNRARYDGQQEVERLADRIRLESRLDSLTDELLGVATATMQPESAAVWIRDGE